ncbi:hypothetical protein L3X38_041570 [Prunus dulcis]|uniref:Malectin-like domain-containing protein n=1 Tax=Prunus dulcis TaxID=3755 RepID=A0AAD4YJE3_PRUDU|nr:hypothetical protein L3X38_041570 [Prunus dulcis]
MMKPILSTHLYFSLFLHMIVVTIFVAGDSPPIYKPVEDITVNCGTSGNILNVYDNRNWSGDINSKFSPLEPQAVGNTSSRKHLIRTRFFNLNPGQKFIRLYFYPASYPDYDPSKALFSINAGGFTLLHDFNALVTAAASGPEEMVYKEFCMNIREEEKEESLNITFSPSKAIPDAYAFINGIEIVSMPINLYYTDGIQSVFSKACLRARRSARRSEAGGKRPRRSAVSRVARLALGRRERRGKAWLGGPRHNSINFKNSLHLSTAKPIGDPRTQERGNIHVRTQEPIVHSRTQEPIVHSRTQDPMIDDDLILDDDVLLSSLASKKRKDGETSSKRKVKSKSIRAMLMDEDDEIDKDPSTFDSGKYPFHIDTVDQYDSDASLNDISVEEWDE